MSTQTRSDGILQHGTATGHFHQAQGCSVQVTELDGRIHLQAPKGARIVHQEHKPFYIAPRPEGYDRLIVREYDHFAEEAREVVD